MCTPVIHASVGGVIAMVPALIFGVPWIIENYPVWRASLALRLMKHEPEPIPVDQGAYRTAPCKTCRR